MRHFYINFVDKKCCNDDDDSPTPSFAVLFHMWCEKYVKWWWCEQSSVHLRQNISTNWFDLTSHTKKDCNPWLRFIWHCDIGEGYTTDYFNKQLSKALQLKSTVGRTPISQVWGGAWNKIRGVLSIGKNCDKTLQIKKLQWINWAKDHNTVHTFWFHYFINSANTHIMYKISWAAKYYLVDHRLQSPAIEEENLPKQGRWSL